MNKPKLTLNKARIAQLNNVQMRNVIGGFAEEEYESLEAAESASSSSPSTIHSFTCSWCMKVKVSAEYKGVKVSGSTR